MEVEVELKRSPRQNVVDIIFQKTFKNEKKLIYLK